MVWSFMPYPNAWRPGRPSSSGRAVAAALPAGWSFPAGRRFTFRPPRFTPGRHFPGLLLAGLILDAAWNSARPGEEAPGTMPMPNTLGWTHVCGPFPHPGPPYQFQVRWRYLGAPDLVCNIPLAGQAGFGTSAPLITSSLLYVGYGPNAVGRHYAFDKWSLPAGILPKPLATRPIGPVEGINVPPIVVPLPPLVPVVTRPVPLVLTPPVVTTALPESPYRGYILPPVVMGSSGTRNPPNPIVRFTIIGADVRSPNDGPERKVPENSAVGQALRAWFGLLSIGGTIGGFVDALWRSIPPGLRTPHARTPEKLRDLAANWGDVDLGETFANSLMQAAQVAFAGAMYRGATDALSGAFGEAGGFGLYRAWATGERAYGTSPSSYNPHRWTRGGGSIAERQYTPPFGHFAVSNGPRAVRQRDARAEMIANEMRRWAAWQQAGTARSQRDLTRMREARKAFRAARRARRQWRRDSWRRRFYRNR